MSSYLWRYYLENDAERFQRLLQGSQPYSYTTGHRAHRAGLTTPTGSYKSSLGGTISAKNRPGSPPANVVITKKMLAELDAMGRNVLHLACTEQDRLPFVTALLAHPLTDPTLVDLESGWTCLHRALYHANISAAREIILASPSNWSLVKSKDNAGDAPFDVFEATIEEVEITPEGRAREDVDDGLDGDSDTDEATVAGGSQLVAMGDEVFFWGSNKNMTLGFIDGDDRSFPERIPLHRPRHLLLEQAKRRYHDGLGNQGKTAEELLDATVLFNPIRIQEVFLSKFHTAILTDDPHSNLFVCGFGRGGRLGFGEEQTVQFTFRPLSPPLLPKKRVVKVALGQDHTVVVLEGGDVYSWGRNQCGQLGYAQPQKSPKEEPLQPTPRQVFGLIKREIVIGCAASRVHTAVFTEDSLFTFGKNDGQLGILDSSDAQTVEVQSTPRKVSAMFLNGTKIKDVVAIDKATVILLENSEVWILAGYGYSRLTFPMERFFGLPAGVMNVTRYDTGSNSIMKITGGGDTICTLSQMGDVFALDVDATLKEKATRGSGKVSWMPQRAWSLRKKRMAVRDVDIGADGNIIICTQSGSVWSRVKRAKIKESGGEAGRYKFDRVPGLTRITSVRSNTTGSFAAIRKDSDLMRTRLSVEPSGLWDEVSQMLSFGGLFALDEDAEDIRLNDEGDEEWGYGPKPRPEGYSKAVAWFTKQTVEEELQSHLADLELHEGLDQWDMTVSNSKSEAVCIPVHSFILSRSPVLRKLVSERSGSVPGVCEIVPSAEKLKLVFHDVELLTVLNLVYYLYVDTVIDLWHRRGTTKPEREFFKSLRTELSEVAVALGLAALHDAVGRMHYPSRCLDNDLKLAYGDPAFFETADMIIDAADGEAISVHSTLMRVRCPFFDALYGGGAGGRWLLGRQMEKGAIHVDMKHVPREIIDMVVSWLYYDWDVEGFDGIRVGVKDTDIDQYLDFVLDVLATANELMLERLSQICQKVIGRYVNTRNAAGLLSACAPCSEKGFKQQCLQYICSNLETMLENHLLDGVDDDLMAELDEAVRANQKRLSPRSRTGRQEQQLLEKYPTMKDDSEKERAALIAHYTAMSEEQPLSSSLKFSSPSSSSPQQPKRKAPKATVARGSPLVKPAQQGHDDIFSMDDDEIPRASSPIRISTGIETNAPTVRNAKGKAPAWGGIPQQSPCSFPQEVAFELPAPPPRRSSIDPWQAPSAVKSDKLDLKEIMSQAAATASGRSALTAQLMATSSSSTASPKSETPQKLSQKERKRQQQQQQMTSSLVMSTPPSTPDKKAPWNINPAASTPRVSLKEVLASSSSTLATPPSVAPIQQRAAMASLTPKSPAVRNVPSASSLAVSPPVHRPRPSEFLPLSIQDIIDQEEAQKVLLKEYQMKRNLQEIQEEQEFLQWWEAESRRVKEEEEAQKREEERKARGGKRGGRGGRGSGGGGGGRGKGKARGGKTGGSGGGDTSGGAEGGSGPIPAPAPAQRRNSGPGPGPGPGPRPVQGRRGGRRNAPPTAAATAV